MKKLILIVAILLCMPTFSLAQTVVKKFPGQTATFTWDYLVADEPSTTGFRMYSGPTATGPFVFTNTVATPASLRTVALPAKFPSGNIKVFYTVRAFFQTTQGVVESVDSNTVEVDMNVHTATALKVN